MNADWVYHLANFNLMAVLQKDIAKNVNLNYFVKEMNTPWIQNSKNSLIQSEKPLFRML